VLSAEQALRKHIERNIEVAAKVGMRTVLMKGADQLRGLGVKG
jgi:hypothetical protein